jgi:hypothetical protein
MPESQFDEYCGLRQIAVSWAKYELLHAHVQKSTASVSHVGLLNVIVENLMHLILFFHWVAVLNAVGEKGETYDFDRRQPRGTWYVVGDLLISWAIHTCSFSWSACNESFHYRNNIIPLEL